MEAVRPAGTSALPSEGHLLLMPHDQLTPRSPASPGPARDRPGNTPGVQDRPRNAPGPPRERLGTSCFFQLRISADPEDHRQIFTPAVSEEAAAED